MNLVHLALLVTFGFLAFTATTGDAAKCDKPRVRRSWTAHSEADRELYKDAIAAAMDSGKYIKFVEMHTEMMSELEADEQCMFIYWHRAFLAAFENMFRQLALGDSRSIVKLNLRNATERANSTLAPTDEDVAFLG